MFKLPIHLLLLSTPLFAEIDFNRDVRPILNKNCIACHGGVKEAGEVSFIFREQVLGKGESGKQVVVPGKPEVSEMIARIITDDPDDLMPQPDHGPRLSDRDVETLRKWIKEGAKWGEHWSFVAPKHHESPSVKQKDWPIHNLDHFILAKLESENLKPAPTAKASAWLRRASLDLIGLPPTIAELDAFEAAASKNVSAAIAAETERLLASPRFGERWTSVWMDLARYADSEGLGQDANRNVWKYRDWVIDAFNKDLPYSQFIIDQLAGDLVPNSTLDQKLATTFHRLTQVNNEGGTDDEEFRLQAAMDRNVTTWEVFQGLTMGCVQCHSHPYDPIKHTEYYTSLSFFNNTRDADALNDLPFLPFPLDAANYPKTNSLLDRISKLKQSIHQNSLAIDAKSSWLPVTKLTAASPTAEMSVVMQDGYAEFRASDNARINSTYTLTTAPPSSLSNLTALRITYLPKDEKKALTDAEWGSILSHIKVQKISVDGKAEPLELIDVIADEAEPLHEPTDSLNENELGWGTHYKFYRPRHATFVFKSAIALAPQEKIQITIQNGGLYLASFPMVAKRGRIAFSSDPAWIALQTDPAVVSARTELAHAKAELKAIPSIQIPVIEENPAQLSRITNFFNRGNWLDKGQAITASNTPQVFPALKAESAKPTRLDLAKWIASPQNPLTARVAVNRFWLELFGVGIVPTPEDFGSAGEKPTHPELLDTLALEFAGEMKWSIKTLLRKLVTSAAYRQSSVVSKELHTKDAENRLIARGPRQRLTGEMARDAALTASCLLHHQLSGAPTFPPLPPGVWRPFDGSPWQTPAPGDPQRYRRAVYTYWKRSIPYPTFFTFDAPSRELCNKRRTPSNTPIQALAVLNDPAFFECAQGLARRMKNEFQGSIGEKISQAYRATTSQKITPEQLLTLGKLFDDLNQTYTKDPKTMADMAGTPDGAAYTIVASVILNLHDAITR
jgi:hypothetical protein